MFTNDAAALDHEGLATPEKAILSGPVRVIPREIADISVSSVDLRLPEKPGTGFFRRITKPAEDAATFDTLVHQVLEDMIAEPANTIALLRDGRRYEQVLQQAPLKKSKTTQIKPGGTYLITGGFGGIGLTIATSLATENCTLVLTARAALPYSARGSARAQPMGQLYCAARAKRQNRAAHSGCSRPRSVGGFGTGFCGGRL